MKKIRNILLGLAMCFAFVFVLASCSNVSKSYADKINDAYKNGAALKYDDVKKDFGDECIDLTKAQTGKLVAVKGLTVTNYKEKLEKASPDEKFELISITVVQGNCTYAIYATCTTTEVGASLITEI